MFVLLLLPASGAAQGVTPRPTEQYDEYFRKYSRRYFGPGWDWRVFKAQAMTESRLNPAALSPVGARGLMQLMPSTYGQIASRDTSLKDINDPEWNIAAGIKHNRSLWRQWRGQAADPDRLTFVFASYNAGAGTITRAQGVAETRAFDPMLWASVEAVAPDVQRWREDETLGYVRRIEENRAKLDSRGRVRSSTRTAAKPRPAPASPSP